ncbi:MAG: HIT family protein [Limnobacter sp.]|nr:HIT family protein [Limnobacter sp.]
MNQAAKPCTLCEQEGGEVVFSGPLFRVVWADEPLYPGFLRLIWNSHVREFSQLSDHERHVCIDTVVLLERFALDHMQADKVNVASLGNVVPHLHWHVIPRFTDDPHFPAPVWASPPRENPELSSRQTELAANRSSLITQLAALLKQ